MGVYTSSINFYLTDLKFLKSFELSSNFKYEINVNFPFAQLEIIENLELNGRFSYFNLDNFSNLKHLSLVGTINQDFNLELITNLCYQLESLSLCISDNRTFSRLFTRLHFRNLTELECIDTDFSVDGSVDTNLINRFPKLEILILEGCKIKNIAYDSFSNLTNLVRLNLSRNLLEKLDERTFSPLKKLKRLNLSNNKLKKFEKDWIPEGLKIINLRNNDILYDEKEINNLKISKSVKIIIKSNNNF